MSQEEIIEQLRSENGRLKEKNAQVSAEKAQTDEENRRLRELVEELGKRLGERTQEAAEKAELISEKQRLQEEVEKLSLQVHERKGRVATNSSTSHKPPSTDGYAKKTRSLRESSGKKAGGQKGHVGCTRPFVEQPDEVIILRADKCAECQTNLEGIAASGYERRQKVDLPQIKAQVVEYQAHNVACPHCLHVTRASFPEEIRASVEARTNDQRHCALFVLRTTPAVCTNC